MSVGAAVEMTSPTAGRIIAEASRRAAERGEPCFVISVVRSVAENRTVEEAELVARNLGVAAARNASPIVQEADDVPGALVSVARIFGIRTLFVGNRRRRRFRRSIAEKLLRLAPPFEVVVLTCE